MTSLALHLAVLTYLPPNPVIICVTAQPQSMQKPPAAFKGYEHIKRYWDHHYDTYVAKILPGEYYVTRQDEIITTVVGSCVSACICDSQNGIGGMNHFMLPTRTIPPDKWDKTAVSAATRYGNYAMEHVINEILKHGGRRENLQLKLFGGGRIMQYMANIGQQNINFIRHYVQTEGLKLIAEDLGDIYPRKILFYPLTGRVRVKKLRAMEQGIIERENAYLHNLETHPIDGEVDLF